MYLKKIGKEQTAGDREQRNKEGELYIILMYIRGMIQNYPELRHSFNNIYYSSIKNTATESGIYLLYTKVKTITIN